jgi:hypothetical protein
VCCEKLCYINVFPVHNKNNGSKSGFAHLTIADTGSAGLED